MPWGSALKKKVVQSVRVAFVSNTGSQDPSAGGSRLAWVIYCPKQKLVVLSDQLTSLGIKEKLLWREALSRSDNFLNRRPELRGYLLAWVMPPFREEPKLFVVCFSSHSQAFCLPLCAVPHISMESWFLPLYTVFSEILA